jgi:predicted phosphoribosyltransferase
LYLGGRERAEIGGRTATVIDDGVATGATTRASLRATRLRNPKQLVLAVPIAPTESLAGLREEADDMVCLEHHDNYYRDFRQIADSEVIDILGEVPTRAETAGLSRGSGGIPTPQLSNAAPFLRVRIPGHAVSPDRWLSKALKT